MANAMLFINYSAVEATSTAAIGWVSAMLCPRADFRAHARAGRTPLMICLDSMPLLSTLIDEYDADLDAVDKSGLTALHIAGTSLRLSANTACNDTHNPQRKPIRPKQQLHC